MAAVQVMCRGSSQHRCANPAMPAPCTGNFRTNKSSSLNCENSWGREKSFIQLVLYVFFTEHINVPCKVCAGGQASCCQSRHNFNMLQTFDTTQLLNSWVWLTSRWFIFSNSSDCKANDRFILIHLFKYFIALFFFFVVTTNSQGLVW